MTQGHEELTRQLERFRADIQEQDAEWQTLKDRLNRLDPATQFAFRELPEVPRAQAAFPVGIRG